MGAEDYKKEIVSMLEDVTDIRCLKLIYGATKKRIPGRTGGKAY